MEIIVLLLAVIIGGLLVLIVKPKAKTVALLLTFSGAYLLSITVLKLFPEIFSKGSENIGIFVIIGLVTQLILDFFSKGAEHGHLHSVGSRHFPWALFVSLNIHAFMEGLPLSDHQHTDLLWAIVIHKIPIAMVLVSFLIHFKTKRIYALLFLLIFALMTPLATLAGGNIPFLIEYSIQINAIVAGVFLHIATIILFESSKDHKFNFFKFTSLLLGVALALLM
jgi:zinc transporter ZupT